MQIVPDDRDFEIANRREDFTTGAARGDPRDLRDDEIVRLQAFRGHDLLLDLPRLTTLSADSNLITSLSGLEGATNLQTLTLMHSDFSKPGHLTDLTPLTGTTKLSSLTLVNAGVTSAMLEQLPEKYRIVITLFYLEQKSYEEVAQMLAIPMGTVKTLLHRAKKQLLRIGARSQRVAPVQ